MVYKFCSRIDELLNIKTADDFIDLAAVGCVGDMMSLLDYETIEIIRRGIENIHNPLLQQMKEV